MELYDAELFRSLKIRAARIFKWAVILGIIVGIGILAYLGTMVWERYPEVFQNLSATVSKLIKEMAITEEAEEEIILETPEIILGEEKNYVEVAKQGEGITHLARKALKEYLSENSQNFELTPEHKIYIEDYITKKMGGSWLILGENLEISGDLIAEAIEKAETLTPEQLENLTQYSQLVPFLNY